jgi:hypothetical protein
MNTYGFQLGQHIAENKAAHPHPKGPGLGRDVITGWGASWADLDLDGDLDLVLVNGRVPVTDLARDAERVQAYRNLREEGEPGRFEPFGPRVGLGRLGDLVARGSAAGSTGVTASRNFAFSRGAR